jgi:hypothetical protein
VDVRPIPIVDRSRDFGMIPMWPFVVPVFDNSRRQHTGRPRMHDGPSRVRSPRMRLERRRRLARSRPRAFLGAPDKAEQQRTK